MQLQQMPGSPIIMVREPPYLCGIIPSDLGDQWPRTEEASGCLALFGDEGWTAENLRTKSSKEKMTSGVS